MFTFVVTLCALSLICTAELMDKPCAARKVKDQSVVCVCNETYCDEIIREPPARDKYVAYISSQRGLRFYKTSGDFLSLNNSTCCSTTIKLDPSMVYQTIEGFGGAVTDSAGIHWKSMSDALRNNLINSYFGDNGIQYTMIRVPIGGTDFSTRPYAYNEKPENDTMLSNFVLAYEDKQYKIPMIKHILKTSSTSIHVVATTWSPPPWMKTNEQYKGRNRLKKEYYQTYADYHYKFIQKYAENGVNVWGITTTNEPMNGLAIALINCLGWTPYDMGEWIVHNLGPTIRNSTFKDVKIMTVDDQRYAIPFWFNLMLSLHPNASQYIDGVAVHYYGDLITPASVLSEVGKTYPGKFVLATEACEGSYPWDSPKVIPGSWHRARNYILDMIEDLNHDVIGWIDWNLVLDIKGGPSWVGNYVDSPVISLPKRKEFLKQPMFYAIGHFSKFIPRGSRRIVTKEKKPLLKSSIHNVAFLTTYKTIVVILYNDSGSMRQVAVQLRGKQAHITLRPNSVTTVELPYKCY